MADTASKLQVKQEGKAAPAAQRGASLWQPFESLRQEMDRVFDDFTRGFGRFPLSRSLFDVEPMLRYESTAGLSAPAVDVVENEKEYRITAELPGLDEKDIEVNVADDMLSIRGEKKEEREEKAKNYHLSERRYGSFQRTFQLPAGIDAEKIAASFQKGVLTVTLPKTPEAQKKEKKIAIQAK
ncbi:MAG TPA: Hsp20/alpha crystallin family protein [Candidatus Acidoferrum sp.]|nr:Hsp20/alpha crystallin family protein [Candidatus Acidoferrum sp.]